MTGSCWIIPSNVHAYTQHLRTLQVTTCIIRLKHELKNVFEPVLINRFLWRNNKFIGGPSPNIADYSLVPCLTMLTSSPYWDVADPRVKQYVKDFQETVKCWDAVAKTQAAFVASAMATMAYS